ncbi:MAG: NfeD family protein [Candidatus Methanofastidiosa archaeon]|nr:NfeD family protein [Candidatus Methanofastidiosa archaeon]
MQSSLPSKGDIRNRFIFMYGMYVSIVLILWAFVRIEFLYIVPILAILITVGYVNYRINAKILTGKPLMSSDDFGEYTGVAVTPIDKEGQIRIRGELWKAVSEKRIEKGAEVKVIELTKNMTLFVREKAH